MWYGCAVDLKSVYVYMFTYRHRAHVYTCAVHTYVSMYIYATLQ